jgi:oligopeptide transport system substrate-binding protein
MKITAKSIRNFVFLLLLTPLLLKFFDNRYVSPAQPSTLYINLFSEPPTLDPRHANDITSATVISMLYEGLTRLDEHGKPQLALAEDVSISENGLRYTFKLRDSEWSNGEKLTAHDLAKSWLSTLDPLFPAEFSYRLFVIKNAQQVKEGTLPLNEVGIHIPDPQTLEIELERPTPYLLEILASYTFFPYYQGTDSEEGLISNGPFTLKNWKHDSEIVLIKNKNYWQRDSVYLSEINCLMIEDPSTELSMFEQGELHWSGSPMSSISLDAVPALRDEGILFTHPVFSTYLYKFNTERPPFTNVKIRHALSLAIDRDAIIEHVCTETIYLLRA